MRPQGMACPPCRSCAMGRPRGRCASRSPWKSTKCSSGRSSSPVAGAPPPARRSPGRWSTATTWRGSIVMPRPGAATTCWPASADALGRADHPARDPAPAQGAGPHLVRSPERGAQRICLLHLTSSDGVPAWSECVAGEQPNYSDETIDTAWLAIRAWVAPRILKQQLEGPEIVHAILERDFRGHRMAKAAVEMGCWELFARSCGRPLSALLGGTRERIVTGISLGIQASPEALVRRARAAVEQGYRKIKLKIAPGADVPYVRAVREALGPQVHLMVDANSAYKLDDAEHLRQLDAFDLLMIEQPLGRDDLVRHAALQRRLQTPLCLDESITDVE